jgi:hypothetical protein
VEPSLQLAKEILEIEVTPEKLWTSRHNTIFGGPGAMFLGTELLADPVVDYVCNGEGVQTILQLLKLKINNDKRIEIEKIPNLLYKVGNKSNGIKRTYKDAFTSKSQLYFPTY